MTDNPFVVFEIPSIVPRIENQEGLFSVYLSRDDYDLVWNYSEYISQLESDLGLDLLTKCIIPYSHAEKVRGQLERLGITLYRLFPDLVGLGLQLRREHGLQFKSELDAR